MLFISDVQESAPLEFKTPLQQKVYATLEKLNIPFQRVDTEEVITMEDCIQINEKLDMKMVKTLFLCDRKKTSFYLFITTGDKPFQAKEFSNTIGARLSFAPVELMESILGTKIGAATIFSTLLDEAKDVKIVIDKDVVSEKWYGCSDGTTTGYMKIATEYILNDFLKYTARKLMII